MLYVVAAPAMYQQKPVIMVPSLGELASDFGDLKRIEKPAQHQSGAGAEIFGVLIGDFLRQGFF